MNDKYVLGILKENDTDPWLLNIEGETEQRCQESIQWQNSGMPCNILWEIVTLSKEKGFVIDSEDNKYEPKRYPYTEKAWNRFLEENWK